MTSSSRVTLETLSRRRLLQAVPATAIAAGSVGLSDVVSLRADQLRKQGRSVILLWMQGGPSQFETFDPKPGTTNGGPTTAISTAVPGVQIASTWTQTAKVLDKLAIIRSMTNKEGNHQRATYQLHTGYVPAGSVKHPSLGANIAKQLSDPAFELPAVVSTNRTNGAGFLGVDYEPFVVGNPGQLPQNVATTVPVSRYRRRLGLLGRLDGEFAGRGGRVVAGDHQRLYKKSSRMVLSRNVTAFDISGEPDSLKQRYGDNAFGRGCLLARRLVESGVTFVEVHSRGWDTHQDNFDRTTTLAGQVDPALGTLIDDLDSRGLLEKTLVIWMGEFGRSPRVNPQTGRGHYPRAFSVALSGGGVRGGQVIGATTEDGSAVAGDPVSVPDLFCSICHSLNIDPRIERLSPLGRPMKIVDGGQVVEQLFA
ncbi:MAG: hypothetical protein CMJ65_14465 [Planctomycetaceae bacterium]|jgi:hypothetical protein|nr:hypothetical protein [Planctomycetaceae bacterium]MDP7277832.1 DUF1501 domain-containing protein [Planctomycetaceae bacterium]